MADFAVLGISICPDRQVHHVSIELARVLVYKPLILQRVHILLVLTSHRCLFVKDKGQLVALVSTGHLDFLVNFRNWLELHLLRRLDLPRSTLARRRRVLKVVHVLPLDLG